MPWIRHHFDRRSGVVSRRGRARWFAGARGTVRQEQVRPRLHVGACEQRQSDHRLGPLDTQEERDIVYSSRLWRLQSSRRNSPRGSSWAGRSRGWPEAFAVPTSRSRTTADPDRPARPTRSSKHLPQRPRRARQPEEPERATGRWDRWASSTFPPSRGLCLFLPLIPPSDHESSITHRRFPNIGPVGFPIWL
jgi:hypothetical protein